MSRIRDTLINYWCVYVCMCVCVCVCVCVSHVVAVASVQRQSSFCMLSRAHVTTTVTVAAGKSRQSEISSLKGHKTSPFRFVSYIDRDTFQRLF